MVDCHGAWKLRYCNGISQIQLNNVICSEIYAKQKLEKYEGIQEKLKVNVCQIQAVTCTFLVDVFVVQAKWVLLL